MTPDFAELLNRHRRTIAALERQSALMQAWLDGQHADGAFGTHGVNGDTTAESIRANAELIADLQRVIDKYDPEGFTKLV